MDIVACCDKGFMMPTGVMMYSVCANNPDVAVVFHIVIDESIADEEKSDLEENISGFQNKKCVFYRVSNQLTASFPLISGIHISRAAYYRIFLAEILPQTLDKVLYLDGDIIVRHSLLPLWNTDLSDNYAIGAAIDWAEERQEVFERLGYSRQKGHFNSGVMLINLDYWRTHDIAKDCINYLTDYPERIVFVDQDVLNVVLQDKKLQIPLKYNYQTGFLRKVPEWNVEKHDEEIEDGMKDPVIVHFTEANKPWLKCLMPHPFRSTFVKYQKLTRWKGVRYDRRPMNCKVMDFMRFLMLKLKLKSSVYIDVKPVD